MRVLFPFVSCSVLRFLPVSPSLWLPFTCYLRPPPYVSRYLHPPCIYTPLCSLCVCQISLQHISQHFALFSDRLNEIWMFGFSFAMSDPLASFRLISYCFPSSNPACLCLISLPLPTKNILHNGTSCFASVVCNCLLHPFLNLNSKYLTANKEIKDAKQCVGYLPT